jgi:hypothetical protein
MQSLERRIAELEKASSTNEWPMTIVIRGMTCGKLDAEIYQLHDSKGSQQWMRQPGETEQEFIDRASCEVTRNGPGIALLMAGA